ncbi:Putative sialic acid transporter [uncultured archaeon]|nr:Putative sialic acid transporter [uncultured archaeon]
MLQTPTKRVLFLQVLPNLNPVGMIAISETELEDPKDSFDSANRHTTASSYQCMNELMDRSKLTPLHWRIWLLSSLGIFLDGFDFFVIGIALTLIIADLNPSLFMVGALGGAAVFGSVFGAVIGGRLTDRWGRKAIYIVDLMFFIVFTTLSAVAWDIYSLIAFRFLLGIGLGADYPICASYVFEFMPRSIRGKMLIGAFSFQALGMLTAALVGLMVLWLFPSMSNWRLILFAGAIPAAAIMILRAKIPESARWYMEHGMPHKAEEVVRMLVPNAGDVLARLDTTRTGNEGIAHEKMDNKETGFKVLLTPLYFNKTLLATVPWFLMDIATYGIGVFTPLILGYMIYKDAIAIDPVSQSFLEIKGAAFLDLFLIIGFALNLLLVEKMGRLRLQKLGFLGIIVGLLMLASLSTGTESIMAIFGGFVIFNVFMNMGPNATTFIIPAEIFPTHLRGTAHGLAAAAAKFGAMIGLITVPVLQSSIGLPALLIVIAIGCTIALAVTNALGIETTGRSLEELSGDSCVA